MIKSDKSLKRMLKSGDLVIRPLTDKQIQPASIDIRLGNTFRTDEYRSGMISLDEQPVPNLVTADEYIIHPGQFVLASTMEYIELPDNLTAFVEGRSSMGRIGLSIQSAGWVDPGFKGSITLQLYNFNKCSIKLVSGMRMGQLVFAELDDHAENPYNGKYQGQTGATGTKVFLDKDVTVSDKKK